MTKTTTKTELTAAQIADLIPEGARPRTVVRAAAYLDVDPSEAKMDITYVRAKSGGYVGEHEILWLGVETTKRRAEKAIRIWRSRRGLR